MIQQSTIESADLNLTTADFNSVFTVCVEAYIYSIIPYKFMKITFYFTQKMYIPIILVSSINLLNTFEYYCYTVVYYNFNKL